MTKHKMRMALGVILALGVWGVRSEAAATNPAYEDLTVTFNGNLSVKVDGLQYSTRTLGSVAAGVTVVPTSATVTNDGTFTEKWQLSATDINGAPNWVITNTTGNTGGGTFCSTTVGGAGCPGLEQFALQALFISSAAAATCPVNNASAWDTFVSTVGAAVNTYMTTQYADTALISGATGTPDGTTGTADGNMLINNAGTGVGQKGLCVRLTMPASVNTATAQQVIRLTITAINGG